MVRLLGVASRCVVWGALFGAGVFGQTTRQPDLELRGRVTLADGSPIPKPAATERDRATGRATWEARTDRDGNYIVRVFASATMGGNGRSPGAVGDARCVLRASLPGYQSSNVDFTDRWFGSDTNLPSILLFRRGAETSSLLELGVRVPGAGLFAAASLVLLSQPAAGQSLRWRARGF